VGQLDVRLFGGASIRDAEGNELKIGTRKGRALLGFLIVEADRWHSRDRLTGLLWGDRQQAQARHSLTQELGAIRKLTVGKILDPLQTESERVRLRSEAVSSDVFVFSEKIDTDPQRASTVYGGPLLDDIGPIDPGFDDWLQTKRASFHALACEALTRVAQAAEARGDTPVAVEAAKRWLALDPCSEAGHRMLMSLYVASGDRAEAVRQFQQCEERLRSELDVTPSEETLALLRFIKSGKETNTSATPIRGPKPVEAGQPALRTTGASPAGRIGVLPFESLSEDPQQDFFADGLSEDLITALSHVRTLNVLSRHATFAFKGKSVDPIQLGETLDVQYLVEGSVRRAGDRVRVSAKLIDAATGDHIWAERYDGKLDGIFDLQDRITASIVGTIEHHLVRAEGNRLRGKLPENMAAYDWMLRGMAKMHLLTPEATREARECFEKAIELDPSYGRAYVFASWCYRRHVQQSGLSLPADERRRAIALAYTGLRLDRNDPYVLVYAGATIECLERKFDDALALYERALRMVPTSHRFWNGKASIHSRKGEPAAAIEAGQRAIALSQDDPAVWVAYWAIAEAHLQELRYEEAIKFARKALQHNEHLAPAHHIIAASAAHLERMDEAKEALERALGINPDLTLRNFAELFPVSGLKNLDRYLKGLSKAGLRDR